MGKSREKVLNLRIHFVPDLVEKQNAYGLYYRLRKRKNVTDLYIDKNHVDQLDLINTFFHEFTHFIVDIVLNEDNYNRFVQNTNDCKKIDVSLGKEESEDKKDGQDLQEEKLCNQIAGRCTAIIKKQLNILPWHFYHN